MTSRSSSEGVPPTDSIHEWQNFLTGYAQGNWASFDVHAQPGTSGLKAQSSGGPSESADGAASNAGQHDSTFPLYRSVNITSKIAANVRDFYKANNYLPPPRSPHEALRGRIVAEYDLHGPIQGENIKNATELIRAYFPESLVTFTLFDNHLQRFYAISGTQSVLDDLKLSFGMNVDPSTSLCGHSVLQERDLIFVPDLTDDWRFASNPYVSAGIRGYIGSPVTLEVDPLHPHDTRRGESLSEEGSPNQLPIGVLNILFMHHPVPTLSATQEMVIRNITTLLEAQFRATWELGSRTREAKVRKFTSELIEEAFLGHRTSHDGESFQGRTGLSHVAQYAFDQTIDLHPEVSDIVLFDLRGIRQTTSPLPSEAAYTMSLQTTFPVSILASGHHNSIGQSLYRAGAQELGTTTLRYLERHGATAGRIKIFAPKTSLRGSEASEKNVRPADESTTSGFERYFDSLDVMQIISTMSSNSQPLFTILAIIPQRQDWRPVSSCPMGHVSLRQEISNPNPLVSLLSTLGAILQAKAIQTRVLEADAAKTAFLSSISHELRTPMHSIVSGLELIKDSIVAGEFDKVLNTFEMVESSGWTLNGILNDILDFGRIETEQPLSTSLSSSSGPLDAMNAVSLDDTIEWVSRDRGKDRQSFNLVETVRGALNMCWLQQQHQMQGQSRLRVDPDTAPDIGLEVVLEYEDRDWMISTDQAKLQRILINGLTNALKFCQVGLICIRMTSTFQSPTLEPSLNPESQKPEITSRITSPGSTFSVIISISDTGIGFAQDSLAHLMEPFTKADTFSVGTGLGLYITKHLASNLGGRFQVHSELGVGTTFEVEFPLREQTVSEIPSSADGHVREVIHRRNPTSDHGSMIKSRTDGIIGVEAWAPLWPAQISDNRSPESPQSVGSHPSSQPSNPSAQTTERSTISSEAGSSGVSSSSSTKRRSRPMVTSHESSVKTPQQVSLTPGITRPSLLSKRAMSTYSAVAAIDELRILIVDDNAICRRLLHAKLRRLPFPTIIAQASDGLVALREFAALQPHVVLTDISMPIMDGVTSAVKMRELETEWWEELQGGWADIPMESGDEEAINPRTWHVRSKIYAVTGLGSSDPRLRNAGLVGAAELDGWLIKGKDDMDVIMKIVQDVYSDLSTGTE